MIAPGLLCSRPPWLRRVLCDSARPPPHGNCPMARDGVSRPQLSQRFISHSRHTSILMVESSKPAATDVPKIDQPLTPRVLRAYGYARRERLAEAEALCREELEADPHHIDALLLLACIFFESGRAKEGGDAIERVV